MQLKYIINSYIYRVQSIAHSGSLALAVRPSEHPNLFYISHENKVKCRFVFRFPRTREYSGYPTMNFNECAVAAVAATLKIT